MKLPGKDQLGPVRILIAAHGRAGGAMIREVGKWLATPPGMALLTGCQTTVSVMNWLGH